jgi:hypothetical protein
MEKLKASDLRIGNWVMGNKPFQVEAYNISQQSYQYKFNGEERYSAIKLTEDWLIRFGFTYDKIRKCWDKDGFIISTYPNGFHILIAGSNYELKYVHILQNAFTLTNEELTIKTD